MSVLVWCTLVCIVVAADETPPGLVTQDSEHDLVAEASNSAPQAQKREAALSNSYGEPLPSDAYGPPQNIPLIPDNLPAPVYGVPDQNIFQQPPPGAYGPPAPVVFPSQGYQGPPPPIFKPKPHYGPPKLYGPPKTYGPPKPVYGPPKKNYGPPKQSLPKPTYGAPFKPPKISFPKPVYGPPKPVYGPPKPVYGPPKPVYGPPKLGHSINIPNIPLPHIPNNLDFGSFGNNIDLGLNLPAPVYGTPLTTLPLDLKPNFPIPTDTYGPPGHSLGPIGPNDQVVVHGFSNVGHYGPPQPDPNPRPPHPGIPAPPTPPHVLYDGWKPIPGVSQPIFDHVEHNIGHVGGIGDQFGPPPPPVEEHLHLGGHSLPNIDHGHQFSGAQISTGYSSVHQDALADIDLNAIVGGDSNHIDQSKTVYEAHYTENNNHNNGAGLNFIHSGPSGHDKPLDSYGAPPLESLSNGPYPASIRQHGAKGLIPPSGIYGVPPGSQYGAPPRPPPHHLPLPYGSISGGGHTGGSFPRNPVKFREPVPDGLIQQVGHYSHHKDINGLDHLPQGPAYLPPPIRDVKDLHHHTGNHGIGGLSLSIEPSSLYSLPHGGNPINFNQQQPSNLYGSPVDSYSVPLHTVGDHTGSGSNINEVKASLDGTIFANLSNLDVAAILKHCPYHEAILKAAKYGENIPSQLASSYVASLSSLGSTLSKSQQTLMSPQNGFNTPVPGSESVSYNTKDLSSASHTLVQTILPANDIKTDKSENNSIQKGKSLKDESGKHNFKDDGRLKFVSDQIVQTSEKIRNLSEETNKLQQKIVSTSQNLNDVTGQIIQFGGDIPVKGNQGSYSLQIQSADSDGKVNAPAIPHEQLLSEGLLQSILQAIEQPSPIKAQKQKVNYQNSHQNQNEKFQQNTNNFQNELAKFQQNANFQNDVKFQQNSNFQNDVKFQQNSNFQNDNAKSQHNSNFQNDNVKFQQTPTFQQQPNFQSNFHQSGIDTGGLVLPAGYEPVDRNKDSQHIDQEIQSTNMDIKAILHNEMIHNHRGDIPHTDCDQRADNSITHTIVVPPPNVDNVDPVDDIDENDVAIYFDDKKDGDTEPVTEISVATSISENVEYSNKSPEFGVKIGKKS